MILFAVALAVCRERIGHHNIDLGQIVQRSGKGSDDLRFNPQRIVVDFSAEETIPGKALNDCLDHR
ncbi:hypothetical protein O3S68_15550 [Kosakonia sp. SOY2]|uniref:hypothetical protein n=1 Tax=Kosakonia sp. SOY2 TaxID=3014557 RepID=UPI0022ABD7EF|nr:hypothetical protein [Kosakonia sp. SOY2]MCZ3383701.1 hypothetical protein [Kosakonia sp. SOY2]